MDYYENLQSILNEQQLAEGRVETARRLYPEVPETVFTELVSRDPSPAHKHLVWMTKQANELLKTESPNEVTQRILGVVYRFVKNPKVASVDLTTVPSVTELETLLQAKATKREAAVEGSEMLYEDDRWTVVSIDTFEAAEHFGHLGGFAKWCISIDENYWESYNGGHHGFNKFAMVFDRQLLQEFSADDKAQEGKNSTGYKVPAKYDFMKVAVQINMDGLTYWDANDDRRKNGLPGELPSKAQTALKDYIDAARYDLEEMEEDREEKRLERERQDMEDRWRESGYRDTLKFLYEDVEIYGVALSDEFDTLDDFIDALEEAYPGDLEELCRHAFFESGDYSGYENAGYFQSIKHFDLFISDEEKEDLDKALEEIMESSNTWKNVLVYELGVQLDSRQYAGFKEKFMEVWRDSLQNWRGRRQGGNASLPLQQGGEPLSPAETGKPQIKTVKDVQQVLRANDYHDLADQLDKIALGESVLEGLHGQREQLFNSLFEQP